MFSIKKIVWLLVLVCWQPLTKAMDLEKLLQAPTREMMKTVLQQLLIKTHDEESDNGERRLAADFLRRATPVDEEETGQPMVKRCLSAINLREDDSDDGQNAEDEEYEIYPRGPKVRIENIDSESEDEI